MTEYERVQQLLRARDEGAALLGWLQDALTKFVVFPSPEAVDAVALWIAATHAQDAWEHATRLALISPEKRCGKSRALDVIHGTCHRALITVNISPAALVRSIGEKPPTLLLDEADTVFGAKAADNHEDLRGILNAGHQRNRPYIRWDASARLTEECSTFAMAALASIRDLPDTVMDRAVVVRMRRRAPGERVQPFRTRRDAPRLRTLHDGLAAWATAHMDDLRESEPDMPVEDRAADCWEPLIAVADCAGGDWPTRARKAAHQLVTDEDATAVSASLGVRMLDDCRAVFGLISPDDKVSSESLAAKLRDASESRASPWGEWNLSQRRLAQLLGDYGIHSKDVKIDGRSRKGYTRESFADAWHRYLPPERDQGDFSATAATTATAQVTALQPVADRFPVADRSATTRQSATTSSPLTSEVAQVAHVAQSAPAYDAGIGPCTRCGAATPRYGEGAHPLCPSCRPTEAEVSP